MKENSMISTSSAVLSERRRVTCERDGCSESFEADVIPFSSYVVPRFCTDCQPIVSEEWERRFRQRLERRAASDRETSIRSSGLTKRHIETEPLQLTEPQLAAEQGIDRVIAGNLWGAALIGPPGTGKSLIASRGIIRYIDSQFSGWMDRCVSEDTEHAPPEPSARYVTARDIALVARSSFSSIESELEVLQRYTQAQFLVIDDVGTERLSAHSLNCLLHVVDVRWSSKRPLVITSNLKPSKIAERIAGAEDDIAARRLVDRLSDLQWIPVDGESWRGRKAR
jgi:DNA replication protein DnaC